MCMYDNILFLPTTTEFINVLTCLYFIPSIYFGQQVVQLIISLLFVQNLTISNKIPASFTGN